MAGPVRLDNRVILVTGAGGGLGRAHALALAARGAKVVVNDLGGAVDGTGNASSAPADKVVAEIRGAGGEAVANYDSVATMAGGKNMVRQALDHFSRIDGVVNNAGILRDVSFHKMTEQDWDSVMAVHVKGAFCVTHAAWPHLRDSNYGRVVLTSSAAGIYGNFGQANYSAAKLALVGFGQTLALEGKKRNIKVNMIAPAADSRMTATVMPGPIREKLKPEYVSPLVVLLCSEECPTTGVTFEVGAGVFFRQARYRSKGAALSIKGAAPTADDVLARWGEITDLSSPASAESVQDSMQMIMKNISS